MAIIKCKMCGGDIVLAEDKTYGTCEYCGSTMTFPKVSDEQRLNLFNRANHFRRQNEFDKAIAAYDKILDQDDTDAEAHWGAVLSRYGIEYVEDPVTHERIPTCHRVQLGSILTDADYLAALEHAPDTASRDLYESEAKHIADIQKGILAISAQEKPYDVFICYKETDDSGSRTKDSTLAQDIYYLLTNEGYKVFFSRITLEDKLGQQYEPYIFAALNSAKVMLVIGTKAEYFNAVWVKNEWNRYLDLMKQDRNKLLIPCYRDMDPYDLPEELSALQSQDMSKIGFMQDIIRGVKKVLNAGKEEKPAVVAVPTAGPGVASLHKRAVLFLEDGDWDSASEYFDRILDIDPEYAPAYIGKVQVTNKVRKEDGLARCAQPLKGNPDYQKALRFASEQQKAIYEGYNRIIEERLERERKEAIYREADAFEKRAATEADFLVVAKKFDEAGEIRDARERAANCRAKAVSAKQAAERQAEEYRKQLEREREERKRQEEEARKEAERKAEQERIEAEKRAEQERIEAEKRARQERIEAEKRKKRNRIVAAAVAAILVVTGGALLVNNKVIQPKNRYNAAQALLEEGKYDEAAEAFTAMEGYSDSADKVREAYYTKAMSLLNAGKLDKALESFKEAGDYSDTTQQVKNIEDYTTAEKHYKDSDYVAARPIYATLGDYLDSAAKLDEINKALYAEADQKEKAGNLGGAYETWAVISDYSDCSEKMATVESNYQAALAKWENGDKTGAETDLVALTGWSDADTKLETLREEMADDAVAAEDYDTALAYYAKLKDQTEAVTTKITAATQAKNYQEAVSALDSKNLKTAYAKFVAAGDYSDAAVRAAQLDKYIKANEAMTTGAYSDARAAYVELGNFLDSEKNLETCNKALYDNATTQMESGDIAGAYETFSLISGYKDSAEITATVDSDYQAAVKLMESGDYDNASVAFAALKNYSDSRTQAFECLYRKAGSLAVDGKYAEAVTIFSNLGTYSDSVEKAKEARYNNAKNLWTTGNLQEAAEEYKALGDYNDSEEQLQTISAEIADKAWAEKDYVSALTAYQRLEQTDEIKAKVYELAQACYDEGHFAEAVSAYEMLGQYELSLSKLPIARYAWADQLFNEGNYAESAKQFNDLADMTDSADRAKEATYQLAKQMLSEGQYEKAKATFQSIKGYSDADTLVKECDYKRADILAAEGDYEAAQALFESLDTYSDSKNRVEMCIYERANQLYEKGNYAAAQALYASINYQDSAQRMKDCRYHQGAAMMDAGNYEDAIQFFEGLDEQDSNEKLMQCRFWVGQEAQLAGDTDGAVKQYAYAVALSETRAALIGIANDYAAVNEMEKAVQVLWLIRDGADAADMLREIAALKAQSGDEGIALLALCATGDTEQALPGKSGLDVSVKTLQRAVDTCNLLPEDLRFEDDLFYTLGGVLNYNGYYDTAYQIYSSIPDYKDVDSIIRNDENIAIAAATAARTAYLAQFEVGNIVCFGHYEQDNNTSNGAEDIEWRVLANSDDKATLISVKALDCQKYDSKVSYAAEWKSWEICPLRRWLNNAFLSKAFTIEEKEQIATMTLTTDSKSTETNCITQDKVFLLSRSEAEYYFSSDASRVCIATDYAKGQGLYTVPANDRYWKEGACQWWLRSPDCFFKSQADGVYQSGSIDPRKASSSLGVRPVIVIQLPSDTEIHDDTTTANKNTPKAQDPEKETAETGTPAKLVDGWYLSEDGKYAIQHSELVKKSEGVYSLSFKVRNQSTGKTIYDKEIEIKADGELTLASDDAIQDFSTGDEGKYKFTVVCEKKEGTTVTKFTKKLTFKEKE